jgi:hypothetical protein
MFKAIDIKSATIGVVFTVALLGGSAYAGLLDSIRTSDWPEVQPTAKYTVEVKDFNVRVYEWVSAEDPSVRLVMFAGDKSSGGMSYRVSVDAQPTIKLNTE